MIGFVFLNGHLGLSDWSERVINPLVAQQV